MKIGEGKYTVFRRKGRGRMKYMARWTVKEKKLLILREWVYYDQTTHIPLECNEHFTIKGASLHWFSNNTGKMETVVFIRKTGGGIG